PRRPHATLLFFKIPCAFLEVIFFREPGQEIQLPNDLFLADGRAPRRAVGAGLAVDLHEELKAIAPPELHPPTLPLRHAPRVEVTATAALGGGPLVRGGRRSGRELLTGPGTVRLAADWPQGQRQELIEVDPSRLLFRLARPRQHPVAQQHMRQPVAVRTAVV